MTHLVAIDPLLFEPGDRLSLSEFLERWEQMPALKFAELIDGVVYMPSPLSHEHARRDGQMHLVLTAYAARTGVCEALTNATWLMLENAPQPDVALRLLNQFGGKTSVAGVLASGAPELVVEITRSSRSFDLGPKLALYQRAGVTEYVAVLLEEQQVAWRVLEAGSYRLVERPPSGIFKSAAFPGLWLDEAALWQSDSKRMLDTLQQGLESEECRSFTDRLRASAR
jgi:hypothetical protein